MEEKVLGFAIFNKLVQICGFLLVLLWLSYSFLPYLDTWVRLALTGR